MRANALWMIAPLLLLATPARAHYHLDAPPSAVNQVDNGDPQKPGSLTDVCPAGTATGAVTQVRAGGQLHVKITETVPHGGHYRVAFAADKSEFSFPKTTVTSNMCISTTVADPPVAPILADGLFEHDQNAANAGKVCNGTTSCETDVTVPNVEPGNYVLQVIQWMTPHQSAANNGAYGCFYAHCATIQVMEADANVPDGGAVVFEDAGSTGGSNGSSASKDGGSSSSGGSSGSRLRSTDSSGQGCNVGSANGASLFVPLLAALGVMRGVRRRRVR